MSDAPRPEAALEQALRQVPFLAHIGVAVEEARPGAIVLRLIASDAIRNAEGRIHGAALFAIGELAGIVVAATHPDLHVVSQSQVASRIRYFGTARGDITAHATLEDELLASILSGLARGETRAELSVALHDGHGNDLGDVAVTLGFTR